MLSGYPPPTETEWINAAVPPYRIGTGIHKEGRMMNMGANSGSGI
jgi:hypothetical protein